MKKIFQKNKSVVWLCIVFIVLIIGLISLMTHIERQILIDAHKNNLHILAIKKAEQINIFLESQKEKLAILSSAGVFRELVKDPYNTNKIEGAKERIHELKEIIPGITILTNDGVVIVGDIDLPKTDYTKQPYFTMEEKKITFERYYDPLRKNDYYAVIGPIYDGAEEDKIAGAIAFDLELDTIRVLMKDDLASKTNEVYLIDENGLLLSDSKFIGVDDKRGVLIQEVKSKGAVECLADLKKYQKDGSMSQYPKDISTYLNYMGNEVFGAYAYVPSISGCVISEESADGIMNFSFMSRLMTR